jgi:spore coat polysaccharide biosynthesis protein SpsF
MLPLGGTTVLGSALSRLSHLSETIPHPTIKVLLTDKDSVEALKPIAESHGFTTIVGHPTDVLSRFLLAIERYNLSHVIRATADNPFVIHEIIPQQVSEAISFDADYTVYENIPYGSGVEFVKAEALFRVDTRSTCTLEREHVCPHLYNNPDHFRILRLNPPLWARCPELRLTIDYPEDYKRACQLSVNCSEKTNFYSSYYILQIAKSQPVPESIK